MPETQTIPAEEILSPDGSARWDSVTRTWIPLFKPAIANYIPTTSPDGLSYIEKNSGPNFFPGDPNSPTNTIPDKELLTQLTIIAQRNATTDVKKEAVDPDDLPDPQDQFMDEKRLNPNRPRSRRQGGG